MHTTKLIPLLGLAAAAGCRSATDLEPAPTAPPAPVTMESFGAESAFDAANGVEVAASGRRWPGTLPIAYEITPLRVRVKNASREPIRIDYGQFSIQETGEGEAYRAIAPFNVEGEVEQRYLVPDPTPFEPAWFGRRYHVYDPFAGYYYGTPTAWADPYVWSDADWDYYDAYWAERELPTGKMLARALPPGVLEPGGRVDGWLFFEKVDEDAGRVHLRAELVDAEDGDRHGVARLPFTAEEMD